MVLESTMICMDNSEYTRNGDFIPTRLQAQQEAITMICNSKTRTNPENDVGLLTFAGEDVQVLSTLTTDVYRIFNKLHNVQPNGDINFVGAIRIAHLALRHRQGRNHKSRIVAFVCSPIAAEDKVLITLAKKLKKENVAIDVVSFGEDATNAEKLAKLIDTVNGAQGTSSHLVCVPLGRELVDELVGSPVIQGEEGGIGMGVAGGYDDPNEDPELAMALRISMEEQRQRQEDDLRTAAESVATAPVPTEREALTEEEMLQRALAMSLEVQQGETDMAMSLEVQHGETDVSEHNFGRMSEDEQIAFAMRMSLQQGCEEESPMETEDGDDGLPEAVSDSAFLQSVLQSLPGVDPQSEAVRSAIDSLIRQQEKKDEENGGEKKE